MLGGHRTVIMSTNYDDFMVEFREDGRTIHYLEVGRVRAAELSIINIVYLWLDNMNIVHPELRSV